jgi:hypothetical protein
LSATASSTSCSLPAIAKFTWASRALPTSLFSGQGDDQLLVWFDEDGYAMAKHWPGLSARGRFRTWLGL